MRTLPFRAVDVGKAFLEPLHGPVEVGFAEKHKPRADLDVRDVTASNPDGQRSGSDLEILCGLPSPQVNGFNGDVHVYQRLRLLRSCSSRMSPKDLTVYFSIARSREDFLKSVSLPTRA